MTRKQIQFRSRRDGFTLVEVMLSLFIALLLLYGMNKVFIATTSAVKAGQAVNEATRNGRAAQPILFNDLNNCAPDSPAFIITSAIVPAYVNAADADANNASTGGIPQVSGCLLGDHMHRADMVMFFARGLFKRKTANTNLNAAPTGGGYLTSTTTSNEAFIHYGHLRVAGDGVTFIGPDDFNLTNYAANWVLGRNVILMADSTQVTFYKDLGGIQEVFYPYSATPPVVLPSTSTASWQSNPVGSTPTLYPANVTPLGYGSFDTAGSTQVQSSRYDLAGVTIDQFRGIVTNAAYAQGQQATSATPYCFWWTPLIYQEPFASLNTANTAPYPYTPVPPNGFFPRNRFQGSNVLSPNPMTAQDQANLAPYLLEHVSQFIVEYAGDFVTQDNSTDATSGNVIDTVPDGQIDWVYATKGGFDPTAQYASGDYVIYSGNYYQAQSPPPAIGATPPGTGWSAALNLTVNPPPKQIRWYGMPRDTMGLGHVYAFGATVNGGSGVLCNTNNLLPGVVPLVDVWQTSTNNLARALPYEVETGPTLLLPSQTNLKVDYASPTGLAQNARYTAVWRNDVPAMVRILIKVDDPNNSVQSGPWFEYVFKLK